MTKYYDSQNQRLIYLSKEAEENYWDDHWGANELRARITANTSTWLTNITKRYLPVPAKILEGGCGLGNHVYALARNGYKSVGVDYAPRTVEYLNARLPEIDIQLADVRNLPFADGSFDGYWSLGVIEHFWHGYEEIALEISRVLKNDGYLFLTFPYMSALRQFKARAGYYPNLLPSSDEPTGFYQFALPALSVINTFEGMGFKTVYKVGLDGLKGLKDEIEPLQPMLQCLYDSHRLSARVLKKGINFAFSRSCGHIQLLVMRKSNNSRINLK